MVQELGERIIDLRDPGDPTVTLGVIKRSNNWFEISNDGFKRANMGRPLAHLIREAIANAMDLDMLTTISVTVTQTEIIIEDNALGGFPNPDLISTVFLTSKEDSIHQRGRKGRGLKELISTCNKAIVETVGFTVTFDTNGRTEEKNDRKQGTKITVHPVSCHPWHWDTDLIQELTKIIPNNDVIYKVNDQIVKRPAILEVMCKKLSTVKIVNGYEKEVFIDEGEIALLDLREGEKFGWIHEMGIPVEECGTPFHIDVLQRIPLDDSRTRAKAKFLNEEILPAVLCVVNITKEQMLDPWALTAIGDGYELDIARKVSKIFLGEGNTCIKSSDTKANEMAEQAGFKVVDISNLPKNIKTSIAITSKTAEQAVLATTETIVITPTTEQAKFIAAIQLITDKTLSLLDKSDVKIIHILVKKQCTSNTPLIINDGKLQWNAESTLGSACCGMSIKDPFNFNIINLLIGGISAIIDPYCYNHTFKSVGAAIATVMALHKEEILITSSPGETKQITCIDCGEIRLIKVQDEFQVKRCRACQKSFSKRKRMAL